MPINAPIVTTGVKSQTLAQETAGVQIARGKWSIGGKSVFTPRPKLQKVKSPGDFSAMAHGHRHRLHAVI